MGCKESESELNQYLFFILIILIIKVYGKKLSKLYIPFLA